MDMNKILQNMDSAEKGTYEAGENDRSEMKTILESFYNVAEQDAAPQQLDEIASVTMSGDSADEVAQLVKLMNDAGAPEAGPVGAQPVSMPEPVSVDGPPNMPPKADMVTPKMMDDFESADEEVVQDDYANEPDERYDDHETMTHDLSGGLNRQKGSYADAEDGDNPMAVESKLKEELSKMLKQKMSEKKDQDNDGDNDFDDVKIARMKASGMSHEEAVAKVKGDSDTNEDTDVSEDDDPCWKNYKMVGTKKKNGKEVPNCVPKESATESSKKKEDEIEEGAADTKAKMKQIVSAFKPLTKGEKVVKAFSYKPGKEFASVPVIITENPKADEMYGPFASYIWTEKFGEMSHSYYHPDLEDAVDYAKNEIKDDAEQGNLDPSLGQQRLPFEEAETNNTDDTNSVIDDIESNLELGMSRLEKDLSPQAREKIQSAQDDYVNALKDLENFVNSKKGVKEAAPKNNPVAKNAGKFNKAQVQPNKKKEQKTKAKGVKHKGKDMAIESAPVFDTYIKPIINKTPKQMVEFYDSQARTIINRLSRERRSLAEANTDTRMHDVVIGRLRENLDVVSDHTLDEARRRRYGGGYRGGDINRIGYGDGRGANLGSDKAAFKRREMEVELGDEEPSRSRKFQQGPIYLQIDGKTYKQKGQPKEFSSMKAIQAYSDAMMRNNPNLKGRITFSKSV